METISRETIERLLAMRNRLRYFGLVLGGALIFVELLKYWQRNNDSLSSVPLLFVFKAAVIFMITFQILKYLKGDFFSSGIAYGQAFSLVFRLFLYASLLVGLFSFALHRWWAPGYFSEMINTSVSMLSQLQEKAETLFALKQIPQDIVQSQQKAMQGAIDTLQNTPTPTPLHAMWGTMWSYILWGSFAGFILSFFVRDKNQN